MINSDDFQKAIELINQSSNILITTHIKPDGDACGCLAAMAEVVASMGKKVKLILPSPLPKWYEFLFTEKPAVLGEDVIIEQIIDGRLGRFDLIMIIDTDSYSQLSQLESYIKQADKPILVIDHHETSDSLGNVELIDITAAATSLIVLDFLKYANWPITEKIAQALFVAVASDTGWFQFSNTDSRVFQSCAGLIEAGAKPTKIHHDLYENFTPQRFKLMAAMLNTLELHFDGRFATQYLRLQDFQQTGAIFEDTEDLINECRRISTVEVSALFMELKDGRIKCSLRSRGNIDVCRIAEKFGGGGHKTAAGLYLPGSVQNAKEIILKEVAERFK